MAITDYSDFIVACLTSDGFPERADGWLLIHMDTGQQYIHASGTWQLLGLGLSFAPPTKSGSVTTNASGAATVTFNTPFFDNNYTVAMTCTDLGGNQPPVALTISKTQNGFSLQTRYTRTGNIVGNVVVSWLATRNYNE